MRQHDEFTHNGRGERDGLSAAAVCQRMESLVGPLLDGELLEETRLAVERHLAVCDKCRRLRAEFAEWDAHLRSELAPPALPQRAAAAAEAARLGAGPRRAIAGGSRRRAAGPFSAAAAWLAALSLAALACLLPAPSRLGPSEAGPPRSVPAGHVVRATGVIELYQPSGDWRQVHVTQGRLSVRPGARLRTVDNSLCEIRTARRGTLRLNRNSELVMHDGQRVELVSGQLWCRGPDVGSLTVEVAAQAAAPAPPWSMSCPSDSECQSSKSAAGVSFTALSKQPVSVMCGAESRPVAPGTAVCVEPAISGRQVSSTVDDVAAVLWQIPLLHRPGEDPSDELQRVLESLLARIGQVKASYFLEEQIRALGAPGAPPLLAFAQSPRAKQSPHLRRRAVRLGCELADHASYRVIQSLAGDPDAQVARDARLALQRLVQ